MRALSAFVLLAALALPAAAHPPVSLVLDANGNLYFSDLENVHVLRPDGSIEVVVPGVHTHELWLGPGGELYGEDVRNRGEAYRHRVWRLDPDGTLADVIPWRDGYPDEYHDYAFARDSDGRSYILRRGERVIEVRGTTGQWEREVALTDYRGPVHWLIAGPDGRAHVTVGDALLRLDPGEAQAEVVATGLVSRTPAFDWVHDRHALMGMWPDRDGSVLVAVYSGQVVRRVADDGSVSTVARSEGSWSPVGGAQGPDGTTWILEWSDSNQVRVRRLDRDGSERSFVVE